MWRMGRTKNRCPFNCQRHLGFLEVHGGDLLIKVETETNSKCTDLLTSDPTVSVSGLGVRLPVWMIDGYGWIKTNDIYALSGSIILETDSKITLLFKKSLLELKALLLVYLQNTLRDHTGPRLSHLSFMLWHTHQLHVLTYRRTTCVHSVHLPKQVTLTYMLADKINHIQYMCVAW